MITLNTAAAYDGGSEQQQPAERQKLNHQLIIECVVTGIDTTTSTTPTIPTASTDGTGE